MKVLWLFPLLLVPMASTGDSDCSKVDAIQRVASSASGRWYLMAVKNREIMNEKNKQTKQAECSGFNSEAPCSCTIFDFNSAIPEPFIPEYNITAYSYNMMSEKYDVQNLRMNLVDNSNNMAIFEVISPDPDAEMDVWFLTRSPSMSNYSVEGLHRALARNNMTMEDMKRVVQTDCVYPPSRTNRNRSDKFRIF